MDITAASEAAGSGSIPDGRKALRKALRPFADHPALSVFVLALAVRALLLVQWSRTPYWLSVRLDDEIHQLWAREILDGKLLRGAPFYQSPFYPYFSALVYKLVGWRPAAMLWLQAVAGAGTCAILARAAGERFGARAAWAAGLLAAACAPLLFQGLFFLKETWLILFLSSFVLLSKRAEDGDARAALGAGLSLGLAALCKGNALLLAPVLAFFVPRRLWPRLALGLALPILPATIHNAYSGRDFVLINSTSGFSTFIGNNPEANGTVKYPLGAPSAPREEEKAAHALAEKAAGRPLKASEVSRHWLLESARFAAREPGRWLGLTAFKLALFFNSYDLPDNYDPDFIARTTPTLLSAPLVSFRVAALLGVAGAAVLGLGSLGASGVVYALTVILTFVTERYRAPALVFLLPLAGGLIAAAAERRGNWRRLAWAAPLLLLGLLPLVERTPEDEAQGWVALAQVHFERGEHASALNAFFRAVRASPRPLSAGAYLFGAAAADKAGYPDRARAIRAAGREAHPKFDYSP